MFKSYNSLVKRQDLDSTSRPKEVEKHISKWTTDLTKYIMNTVLSQVKESIVLNSEMDFLKEYYNVESNLQIHNILTEGSVWDKTKELGNNAFQKAKQVGRGVKNHFQQNGLKSDNKESNIIDPESYEDIERTIETFFTNLFSNKSLIHKYNNNQQLLVSKLVKNVAERLKKLDVI